MKREGEREDGEKVAFARGAPGTGRTARKERHLPFYLANTKETYMNAQQRTKGQNIPLFIPHLALNVQHGPRQLIRRHLELQHGPDGRRQLQPGCALQRPLRPDLAPEEVGAVLEADGPDLVLTVGHLEGLRRARDGGWDGLVPHVERVHHGKVVVEGLGQVHLKALEGVEVEDLGGVGE